MPPPYQPSYSKWTPFNSMQGVGGGGPLSQFMMPLLGSWFMGQTGQQPFGISERNMFNRLQDQQFTNLHSEIIANAAKMDRAGYQQFARGLIGGVMGQPWGAEQQRAAEAGSEFLTQITPSLLQFPGGPQFLDILGGRRGSAAVMADFMTRSSRYRLDPVTGRMGMSAESTGAMARGVYQNLFQGQQFRASGLSMGEVGMLHQELFQRGMLPGGQLQARLGLGDFLADPMGAARVGIQGLFSRGQRDEALMTPGMQTRVRELDSRRVSQTLKEYSQAVRAMQDIFGEAGRTNAPMAELIDALNTLSSGGISQLRPGRITQMVRQTANLARQSGIGLDQMLVMQQEAAGQAAAMGINPLFAQQAVQGSMAFSAAFRNSDIAGNPMWGRSSLPQLAQQDQRLRLGASASISANQMGLALRLNEANAFAPGTEAAAYIAAIRAEAIEFRGAGGEMRSLDMREMDFARMIEAGGGGTTGTALRMLGQGAANRRAAFAAGTVQPIVRRLQPGTNMRELSLVMGSAAIARLGGLVRDPRIRTAGLGRALGEVGIRTFMNLPAREVDKPISAMAKAIMATITQRADDGDEAAKALVARGNLPAVARKFAEDMRGEAEEASQNMHHATLADQWVQFNESLAEATGMQTARSVTEARLQTALAGMGTGSMIRRGVQAIMDVKPGDKDALTKVMSTMFGGMSGEEIAAEIGQDKMSTLQGLVKEYRRAAEQWQKQAPGADKAGQWSALEKRAAAIEELAEEAAGMIGAEGKTAPTKVGDPKKGAVDIVPGKAKRGLLTDLLGMIGLGGGPGTKGSLDVEDGIMKLELTAAEVTINETGEMKLTADVVQDEVGAAPK